MTAGAVRDGHLGPDNRWGAPEGAPQLMLSRVYALQGFLSRMFLKSL